ncbi:NUDIX hydrolase [Burkholderia pseudomultivorans]|uniref:NUDIX hydrolase n=1 Tax=Burkholderia pseudomultivorans TaxID=1207504 RepID=A0A132EFP4_9BURK|nr:NUDIX hydrolase [Burkholderia pseudomultivorans]KWF26101.1 NUDIX hydrolase [Burkholderia pseudomultivorans]MDR8730617.1 RNA pyrophosphohydrolase [Burkholderia pseudomultivorans]MDR8734177.1 RNA pyrophosphohydrolase [Burkholderia pseudomultivorans]MDR8743509.1 RNA pyrophosphohydrolase [Burkholderia pseudomultivorans]MDR8753335.1 RNA pyrophosphohydrolase [Burkholderia pseudomultivorans]
MSTGPDTVKERATIVCRQRSSVLLVARTASRWALPGGTIRRGETPLEAAQRELAEETRLEGLALHYAVQFGGLMKLHHVFVADVPKQLIPRASNEIVRCKWFAIERLETLHTSVPTRKIVELLRLDLLSGLPEDSTV